MRRLARWLRVCIMMRMARVNIYLPDELYRRAKRAKLNVSELSQRAIREELLRDKRMQALEEWLGDLPPPTPEEAADAEAWAARLIAGAERAAARRGAARGKKRRGA